MRGLSRFSVWAGAALCALAAAAVELELNDTALTGGEIESDWTAVYYPRSSSSTSGTTPLLLGNDGSAATGGFRIFELDGTTPLPEAALGVVTGRTKLFATLYDVGGRDLVVTIAQPDSVLRVFEAPSFAQVQTVSEEAVLGDWNAMCPWRSRSGNSYFFMFGKGGRAFQFLVRPEGDKVELVEVQSFTPPALFVGCAVSQSQSKIYLTEDVDQDFYVLDLVESTAAPVISKVDTVTDATGITVYVSNVTGSDYVFVAKENAIAVLDHNLSLLGNLELVGLEDVEIQGLSIYQAATTSYPLGAVAFAIEADGVAGFGIASLADDVLEPLGIAAHTSYDPRVQTGCRARPKICSACSNQGYCQSDTGGATQCSCFSGSTGPACAEFRCEDNCSGRGRCAAPGRCSCDAGWGGLHCSFLLVEPSFETDANGGDGDDPAIWISPVAPELSRIITTTKSEADAGLAVFDLQGKQIQSLPAGEPNNVDVIYGFQAGSRKVDLAFAACRADDTLCLFEVTPNGTLTAIPGGSQPVVDDYTVYGSCVYRSPSSGKQYLFVNEKSARYLQYELNSTADGTLQTTLVRDFVGGSGGQVEGCVVDEQNGWLFLGEEPSALWRYGAEPDDTTPGLRVAHVGDGTLNAEVEGVTMVLGSSADKGFILVSNQGVSSYTVYRRAEPHDYVTTFTITKSADGRVDAVSNTDGIAAVGNALGPDFPHGLVVVHDDANELAGGGTSAEASFKLVSLERILGAEPIRSLGLLDDVDADWDPRA